MRIREAAKMLAGSIVVYLAMAACVTDTVSEAQAQPSGSRLKANWLVGSDGSRQFQNWHDTQLNMDCLFLTAADGTTRCLPSDQTITVTNYYADSACSQQLAGATVNACSGPATGFAFYFDASTCTAMTPYRYRLYQVQGPFTFQTITLSDGSTTTNLYQKSTTASGTSCVTVPASSYLSEENFYFYGAEIPASLFVQATIQTDP
jgi:hypothetical protein